MRPWLSPKIYEMKSIDDYEINENFLYDPETHYWVEVNGSEARIGMSSLVQETSGSFVAIVFDGLKNIERGESFGSIEAEKHVGQLKAPVSGSITEVNDLLIETPRLINNDPYGEGWLVKMKLTDPETDIPQLIAGREKILEWYKSELKKFEDKGWIAQ
jgi:glycine cleavage system H protein